MWCGIVTLFPEMFKALTSFGMTRKAIKKNLLKFDIENPRNHAIDKHKTVDDRPYGGGPGMVMKVEPLRSAILALKVRASSKPIVIALSPQGIKFTQKDICDLVKNHTHIIFVAGRYEGIDKRLYKLNIDIEWSIGDYIISGGELGAMVIIDALTRIIPGVLNNTKSAEQESFMNQGLLDYPHYTRPKKIYGLKVPKILLHGNHEKIMHWRKEQSLKQTIKRRPDLLKNINKDKAK